MSSPESQFGLGARILTGAAAATLLYGAMNAGDSALANDAHFYTNCYDGMGGKIELGNTFNNFTGEFAGAVVTAHVTGLEDDTHANVDVSKQSAANHGESFEIDFDGLKPGSYTLTDSWHNHGDVVNAITIEKCPVDSTTSTSTTAPKTTTTTTTIPATSPPSQSSAVETSGPTTAPTSAPASSAPEATGVVIPPLPEQTSTTKAPALSAPETPSSGLPSTGTHESGSIMYLASAGVGLGVLTMAISRRRPRRA